MRMLSDMRAAFSSERLSLVYQPLVELSTGRVTGTEALLRWEIEPGHWVPPDQFIPLAEQSGLIVPLGEWVLRTACRELRRLSERGHAGLRMAINVSHAQFREPGFVPMLKHILTETQVTASQIELELTESLAIEHVEGLNAKLAEIRGLGIRVAVDDFGTGYSSLSVLRQLQIDRLKIDRSFISEPAATPTQGGILPLIVALGQQCNLTLIAEGIETEAQRQHLLSLGCQEGQGFLFARPMPIERLEDWLAAAVSNQDQPV
jgi:FOG: EAL domain